MALRSIFSRARVILEDRFLTAPSLAFRPVFQAGDDGNAEIAVQQIRATAGFDCGLLVPRSVCEEIRDEITQALSGRRTNILTKTNPRTGIQLVSNPLRLHPAILKYATHPFLLCVVERYLRRKIFLSDVDIRRVPPMSMAELDRRAETEGFGNTSSHWHRDVRGRQVKVMIYLTDVGEHDNNFAFLSGTHRGNYLRPACLENSRFTDKYVDQQHGAQIVECYGRAGTTLIFDTNPIHRLRRKASATVRDSLTLYYTPGQELRPLDIDAESLKAMGPAERAIFGGKRSGGVSIESR